MAKFTSFACMFLLMAVVTVMFAAPAFGQCKPNGAVCQPTGGSRNCCSGFCYKQAGQSHGYCRNRG